MNTNRNFPWWAIGLGIGCLCILCMAIAVVGAAGYIFYLQSAYTPLAPPADLPAQTGQPVIPKPTSPVPPAPGTSEPSLTGEQVVSDFYFFDDFSSEALGWPVFDDGKTILKYEQGQYSFQIAEADYVNWAYAPVAFSALDISFDVRVPANPQNGTFGVFCRFKDADNYYYVEFDLAAGAYVIGEVVADKQIPLTSQNAQGQYWQETGRLDATPGAVNRIAVTCYPDFINLFINSEWETEVSVTEPFDEAWEMALFVYAFPFAGDEGFKVYFDNVEIFTPVQ